jgi:hypothetical protein
MAPKMMQFLQEYGRPMETGRKVITGETATRTVGRKLTEFAIKPGNRLQFLPLHTTEDVAGAIYATALAMDGMGYNTAQLVYIALSHRYGTRVPSSPKRTICSEAHARILYPFFDIRDIHHRSFEEVTPQSAWIRHLEIRTGYNPSAIEKEKP